MSAAFLMPRETEDDFMHERYFVCANSSGGFFSLFDRLFSSDVCERIFEVKGCPGCGKSTFLNACDAYFRSRGYETERILCSSDPSSLDGVYCPALKTVLLDCTAPHLHRAALPGACESEIDLLRFADRSVLRKKRELFRSLADEKTAAYRRAYHLLSAAGECRRTAESIYERAFLPDAADRVLTRLPDAFSEQGTCTDRFVSAFCADGRTELETEVRHRIVFAGAGGAERAFFDRFDERIRRGAVGGVRYLSVENPEKTEGFRTLNGEYEIRFGKPEAQDAVIRLSSLYDRASLSGHRAELRAIGDAETSLYKLASSALRAARTFHFLYENEVREAMDFPSLSAFSEAFAAQELAAIAEEYENG